MCEHWMCVRVVLQIIKWSQILIVATIYSFNFITALVLCGAYNIGYRVYVQCIMRSFSHSNELYTDAYMQIDRIFGCVC